MFFGKDITESEEKIWNLHREEAVTVINSCISLQLIKTAVGQSGEGSVLLNVTYSRGVS